MKTARPVGPTAERVARNVEHLRRQDGLELKELSARLGELGQPISVSQLSRLESIDRRVDVDDLMALAVALDVSPLRLLLTEEATPKTTLELTPTTAVSTREAWRWGAGVEPLRQGQPLDLGERLERFTKDSAPHVERDSMTTADLAKHQDVLVPFAEAARAAVAAGVPWATLREYVGLTQSLETIKKAVRRGKR